MPVCTCLSSCRILCILQIAPLHLFYSVPWKIHDEKDQWQNKRLSWGPSETYSLNDLKFFYKSWVYSLTTVYRLTSMGYPLLHNVLWLFKWYVNYIFSLLLFIRFRFQDEKCDRQFSYSTIQPEQFLYFYCSQRHSIHANRLDSYMTFNVSKTIYQSFIFLTLKDLDFRQSATLLNVMRTDHDHEH